MPFRTAHLGWNYPLRTKRCDKLLNEFGNSFQCLIECLNDTIWYLVSTKYYLTSQYPRIIFCSE